MSIIKTEKSSSFSSFKGFGPVTASDDGWLESLPVDVVRSGSRFCGRTPDGVWVSAGASYGAQVEFPTAAAAAAFIAANEGTRQAIGTTRPRDVADTVALFIAAYNAAAGKAVTVKAVTVKAEETVTVVTAPAAVTAPAFDAALWAEFQAFKAFLAAQGK